MFRRKATSERQQYAKMDEESRGNFVSLGIDVNDSPTVKGGGGRAAATEESMPKKKKRKNGLRDQLHSFRLMSSPYFRENRHGRTLFAIMVVLTIANSAVRVLFSYLARDFWSALSDKDVEKFYIIMTRFVGACALLTPITVAYRFQRQKLAIAWRQWLTGRVLRLYFSNKVR